MKDIDYRRIHSLNDEKDTGGPVLYWMSREQRVQDNWGLLHARFLAGDTRSLIVVFCLTSSYMHSTLRQYDFMLKGLEEVESSLDMLGIPFILLMGQPDDEVPRLARELNAGVIVTDFDPLRIKRFWQNAVSSKVGISVVEVDGHNVVPARFVTNKQEYAARTIRPKIQRLLQEFLEDFSSLGGQQRIFQKFAKPDWIAAREFIEVDETVLPVAFPSGESAANEALDGFIKLRLNDYARKRNDPNSKKTSRLSAYFHFGQLSPQRAALAVANSGMGENQDAYLEELIIRRELSDNFCHYNNNYDSIDGAHEWAQKTLAEFSGDTREYLYTYEDFEGAHTHSDLWNAAQLQMVRSGFMHGYMRMFWAKKILEWSSSPQVALDVVLKLNDRFQLDGSDPNGYVGALWSVAGLHDRAWKKRPVYGSIRYMNSRGCSRKFDTKNYIEEWLR